MTARGRLQAASPSVSLREHGEEELFLGRTTQDSTDGSAADVEPAGELGFGDTCAM